jgi:hypothetical protein
MRIQDEVEVGRRRKITNISLRNDRSIHISPSKTVCDISVSSIPHIIFSVNHKQIYISVTFCGILRWAGHVTRMGEMKGAYKALERKPEGMSPLGRPRRR